ncbi:MAG: GFA family protein [Pseudomonadota bacterium]
MTDMVKGECLCGDVEFAIEQPKHLDVCHCGMCRRWNGGPYLGVDFRGEVRFDKSDSLKWYESSEWATRGFCANCGTSLFYRLKDDPDFWSISAGALDLPDDVSIEKEIFIDEKPDYYAFAGDRARLTGAEVIASFEASNNA